MTDLPTPEDSTGKNDVEAMKHAVLAKSVVNPLDRLPDYVKDPKNFMKIERALLETLACGKSHADPVEMSSCQKCTQNMLERRKLMHSFGFTTPAIYMAWKKVQTEIRAMTPDVDWEKGGKIVTK